MTKLAFPTDDGETISKHLGQARYFQVITLEDGQVQSSERRDKASHSPQDHVHEPEGGIHPGQAMIDAIQDCQVLVSGGMGQPVYNRAISSGLEVYLTGEDRIMDAIQAYREGRLTSDTRRIHFHH
jgi:predicted Fe-Mo cluster-binding NifX family protein